MGCVPRVPSRAPPCMGRRFRRIQGRGIVRDGASRRARQLRQHDRSAGATARRARSRRRDARCMGPRCFAQRPRPSSLALRRSRSSARVMCAAPAHRGGEVALFVLSHPHSDHVGGAASLFSMLHPGRFLDPGFVGTDAPYRAALAKARLDGIPWQRVRPGDSLVVDDIVLTALAPDSAWAAHLADANLANTILMARIGSVRILFTGDAEAPEEAWLLAHSAEALHADVLKVGHHGSSTSTTAAFLAAVHPRVALVSVGAHNDYGHPSLSLIHI